MNSSDTQLSTKQITRRHVYFFVCKKLLYCERERERDEKENKSPYAAVECQRREEKIEGLIDKFLFLTTITKTKRRKER